jgi:DNA repair exonuclease SbcCD ATPase subunit
MVSKKRETLLKRRKALASMKEHLEKLKENLDQEKTELANLKNTIQHSIKLEKIVAEMKDKVAILDEHFKCPLCVAEFPLVHFYLMSNHVSSCYEVV